MNNTITETLQVHLKQKGITMIENIANHMEKCFHCYNSATNNINAKADWVLPISINWFSKAQAEMVI